MMINQCGLGKLLEEGIAHQNCQDEHNHGQVYGNGDNLFFGKWFVEAFNDVPGANHSQKSGKNNGQAKE